MKLLSLLLILMVGGCKKELEPVCHNFKWLNAEKTQFECEPAEDIRRSINFQNKLDNYSSGSGVTWHEGVKEVEMKEGEDWTLIDVEKNVAISSDRFGVPAPDGKITWYGGERPGKTKWVKTGEAIKRKALYD